MNCYFGNTGEMKTYRLGDIYDWLPRKSVQNGGCPNDDYLEGEGYTECPKCGKDFFVIVHVVDSKISQAQADLNHLPYVADKVLYNLRLTCPVCLCASVSEVQLYHSYRFGRANFDCTCNEETYVDLEQTYSIEMEMKLGTQSKVFVFESEVTKNK